MSTPTSQLRVLQYVRVLDNGGIESLIFNLLEKTDRTLVNFDFLLTRDQEESHEADIKKYDSLKVIVPLKQYKSLLPKYIGSYRLLYNYFKSCPYKIVHFQAVGTSFGGSLAILAAKKAGIPFRIVHAHSADKKVHIIRRIDILMGQYLHKKWGTHFMACSEKAAEFSYGKNYKKQCKVLILKNGIDTNKFRFNETLRKSVRREFNIENKFVIGSIGRLSPQKNHIFMLEILKEIIKIRQDAILLIVGSSSTTHEDYENKIKQLIKDSDLEKHVILTGERKDAYRIYNGFDVYLFPSIWEGLGIAAIEAQTNGLPVYSSSVVPKEASIISNFHYIDLDESPYRWAEEICNSNNRRIDEYEKIIAYGYDISNSATLLTEYYLELIGSKE